MKHRTIIITIVLLLAMQAFAIILPKFGGTGPPDLQQQDEPTSSDEQEEDEPPRREEDEPPRREEDEPPRREEDEPPIREGDPDFTVPDPRPEPFNPLNLFDPFIPSPPHLPDPEPKTPIDLAAQWEDLPDAFIPRGSPDGTIVHEHLSLKCEDPDDELLTFSVEEKSDAFDLAFTGDDLRIFDLDRDFIGTVNVKVFCNGEKETFDLHVVRRPRRGGPDRTDDTRTDDLSIHLGTIRIHNQYDAQAGDLVPITITFENNGNDELERLKIAVTIQELALRASDGPFEVRVGEVVSRTLLVDLPRDTEPGLYYARITINDEEEDGGVLRRVVHRELEIIR